MSSQTMPSDTEIRANRVEDAEDARLRNDIRLLGRILGDTVRDYSKRALSRDPFGTHGMALDVLGGWWLVNHFAARAADGVRVLRRVFPDGLFHLLYRVRGGGLDGDDDPGGWATCHAGSADVGGGLFPFVQYHP